MSVDVRLETALELRRQGYGYVRISKALGVSTTTARRWTKPGYAEHLRHLAREAKRRRTGTCVRCGSVTRYNGHNVSGVSDLCATCGSAQGGATRRDATLGKGPTQAKVLAFIGNSERRYREIRDECGIEDHVLGQLLHRLVGYGILERPRRGYYTLAAAHREAAA